MPSAVTMRGGMSFQRFYLDPLAQASYLIVDGDEAAVVDPRREIDDYVAAAAALGARIRWAVATHVHADFVAGLHELAAATGAQRAIGAAFGRGGDGGWKLFGNGDRVQVGGATLEAIATPGHTAESTCWLLREPGNPVQRLLSGDTVFLGDVGRPDLAASPDHTAHDLAVELWHSVHERLAALPDEVEVWPAHGAGSACGTRIEVAASSTLGQQRLANWAFAAADPELFARELVANQRPAPRYFAHVARLNRVGPALLSSLSAPPRLAADALPGLVAGGAVVIDVREAAQHCAGRFPGALGIGIGNLEFETVAGLLLAPGQAIVLHAVDEAAARQAWRRLLRIGLETVRGWVDAVPAGERVASLEAVDLFVQREQAADWQVIDVRTPVEFAGGHLAGAVNAELGPDLSLAPALAVLDRARRTAVICQAGYRSVAALPLLRQAGFTALHNVSDGMRGWRQNHLPLTAGC